MDAWRGRFLAGRRWLGRFTLGAVASLVASVACLGAPIPGLFNSGVNDTGALLPGGTVEPHYRLIQSADPAASGPNAYVINEGWPIAPAASGPWLANGPTSKWIGPQANQSSGNQAGNYTFRLAFDLTGLDPDTAVITGRWSSDNAGVDVLLNDASTGINYDGNFSAISAYWTINSGFVEGTNTLDFIVNNAGTTVSPIGLRVELSGTAELPLPPDTPPTITIPPASATVLLQDPATFSVKARGGQPLLYQWRHDGIALAAATNATLSLPSVAASDRGSYDVVVSNAGGALTSAPAMLHVVFAKPGQPFYEPLDHCTRRTGLVISEIMYHPRAHIEGRNLEFIELYNADPWPEDLSGYRFSGDLDYTFPDGASIPGLGFLVIAPAPADIQAVYGLAGVLGGFTNNLPNDSGTVRLCKRSGAILLEVNYADELPWPAAADGTGHSLVLARPSCGEQSPQAWAASAAIGGSPGAPDPIPSAAEDNVVINEWLAHSPAPALDFIEFYNGGPWPADLSGCWLTDEASTNKFRIPEGTRLEPQGLVAFDESQLGFALSADGETIFLINSNQTRVIDAIRFAGQALGVSSGRHPDGSLNVQPLKAPTAGTNNAAPWLSEVVINEIMFHPLSGNDADEYVELFNRGTNAVDLSGWRLADGLSFSFPANTAIAAGGCLVVARDAVHLRSLHPHLNAVNCLGDFGGSLSNGGERLALVRPETNVTTNDANGRVTTNTYAVVVNEVNYLDRSRWSRFADGGGSSLELIDAQADNRTMQNWADSEQTTNAPWTLVEFTGMVDNAMTDVSADQVQLFLLGEGEALVDNVEVIYSGVNRVPNSTFESETNGWFFQGTQIRTTWAASGGYQSAGCLHVKSSDRGEPIVNRIRAPLSTTIPTNTIATLRARVRWLAGAPEFLMRLRGGGLEAVARLNVPASLGTPGLPNSRAQANAGPAIAEVTHRPVLPPANQPIRVLARVGDPDGVAGVVLKYRLDPATALTSVTMRDDGTGGDLLPGDGVFTATIPGQPKDTMIAFRIEATDGANPAAVRQFPEEASVRECLIRVGETLVPGPFGNYRIWMTQATLNHWATRGNLSNDPLDVTFLYGASRVIYNAGSLYGGSPAWSPGFNSPMGNLCAYDVLLPGDDTLLNEDHLSLDIPIRDSTNQREQLMHWIADQYNLPNLYRRDVYMFVNGLKRGTIYHDTQQPGGDLLEEWFPDNPDGTLVKTTQWSEGTDPGVPLNILLNSLERFTSGGVLKVARYRWNWRPRATDSQLDFTHFLDLVEAVNAPVTPYQSAVEGLVDVEDWMRMFAMNDLCSYWDGFGNPNAKNTFLYKPVDDRWRLIPWDFDVGLGVFNDPVDAALFPSNVDPTVKRMYGFPGFVRAYWRELEHGLNTFFDSSTVTPRLAAKYDAYTTNGLSFTSPFVSSGAYGLSIPGWIDARRNFLLTQLASVATNFLLFTPVEFTTNRNVMLLTGRAPVSVKTITVNGVPYPVIWTSVMGWALQVPLVAGTNVLLIAGHDRWGNVLSNATSIVTVNYTGVDEPPEQNLVINELLYQPSTSGQAYVELYNRSTQSTFDLSNWRLNGLDYTFSPGSLIGPQSYLVLAEDRGAFARRYGTAIPVFGEFNGQFDRDGETLTLYGWDAHAGAESVIDRVRYEPTAPWPAGAAAAGAALQLIDSSQDNSRVSNWRDSSGWRFFRYTAKNGSLSGTRLAFYLDSAGGDVYFDDICLVAGAVAGEGTNLVRNGDFESGELAPWTPSGLATNSMVTNGFAHAGAASLHLVFVPGSPNINQFYQTLTSTVAANTVYTLSFWYQSRTGTNLTLYVSSTYRTVANVRPAVSSTPGTTNNVVAALPPYPPLWLNECQPVNVSGVTNALGERSPWIELFNSGTNALSLDGCYLSDSYTNLTRWAFPTNAAIEAGQFMVVWADGRPEQTTSEELHTDFHLAGTNGSVVLSRWSVDSPQILDYFNYHAIPDDWGYGSVPDGQPFFRQALFHTTPGATNNDAAPPLVVYINEWMAANTSASGFADPADGGFDDWFELYNPNTVPVDLADYSLTDDLLNPSQYRIPAGYVVPARGFLLVWADDETGQNSPERPDLHVSFRLNQGGEHIGLFAPNGTLIDAVSFGPQTNNVSQGRYPDGASPIHYMADPTPREPNWLPLPPTPPGWYSIEANPDHTVTLTFSTLPGHTYRVEYRDDLIVGDWIPLVPDHFATGFALTITDDPGSAAQRFYRVVLLP